MIQKSLSFRQGMSSSMQRQRHTKVSLLSLIPVCPLGLYNFKFLLTLLLTLLADQWSVVQYGQGNFLF